MPQDVQTFIPKKFEEKYSALLGDEYPAFLASCKTKLPRTIRVNSLKTTAKELLPKLRKQGIALEAHPALKDVFYIKTPNAQLGYLPEHQQGLFVVQETSSMLPPLVLDPQPNEVVCDMAAAPGMKTCQMAELMQNTGAIVAVDMAVERLKALWFNMSRMGIVNTLVVHHDSRRFYSKIEFDRVLLDAPCSTEGFVRKRPDALKGWHPGLVEKKSIVQKQLIERGFGLLKKGGVMVYSTCTLSPEENEEVVNHLLRGVKNAQLEQVFFPGLKFRPGLVSYKSRTYHTSLEKTVRVYPQDN
ncbi:MAG: RsmB/NOP family class I SAM-dependent RNA methyltransferase, partial [Candidatus Diapherotrites archaeon]|nr:RsmB/NOP family class I SAM-dependent RNA methyltransferase [Candidatus Diapherotrites archaeon]